MSLESLCVRDAEDWTLAHCQKWSKETKPVNPKGNHPWIFIGKTNAEVEAPTLWPPDAKSQLIGKDPDSGKDWRQEEKGMTEDEIVGWQHWLNGHEFDQTLGDSEGQGSLACYNSWVAKRWTRLRDWTITSIPTHLFILVHSLLLVTQNDGLKFMETAFHVLQGAWVSCCSWWMHSSIFLPFSSAMQGLFCHCWKRWGRISWMWLEGESARNGMGILEHQKKKQMSGFSECLR